MNREFFCKTCEEVIQISWWVLVVHVVSSKKGWNILCSISWRDVKTNKVSILPCKSAVMWKGSDDACRRMMMKY